MQIYDKCDLKNLKLITLQLNEKQTLLIKCSL